MAKSGTTAATGMKMKAASTSGVRHGPGTKSSDVKAAKRPSPKTGRTGPLKGPDRGGV